MATFRTLSELKLWCQAAPPGTHVDAEWLAQCLESVEPVPAPPALMVEPSEPTWRERLWTVPSETRLGVVEVAEAVNRAKSWVYSRTGTAEDPIPHRKLDGTLVFTAGEIRTWIRDSEESIHEVPMTPPNRILRAS